MSERATEAVDDTTYYRRRPRLSTRALTVRTVLLSCAATLLVSAGLAWQMALGLDPGLGPQAAAEPAPRVVKSTVIRRVVGSSSAPSASTGSSMASSAPAVSAPAPVTTSSS